MAWNPLRGQFNPFKGGKYDWSAGAKSAYRYASDPRYRKKAGEVYRQRRKYGADLWGALKPSSFVHKAHASEWKPGVGTEPITAKFPTGSAQGETTTTSGGGGSEPAPFEAWFQGVLYTDPTEYQNAINEAALEEYNRQKASLDRMYDSGILTFEDRERQLGELRDQTIQSQKAYFTSISPEAYQSQQETYEGKTQESYGRGMESTGRERSDFTANTLDAIAQLEQAYQEQKDELANQLLDYTQNVTGPSAQNPADILSEFGAQDLTSKIYGKALPKKYAFKGQAKKAKAPLSSYLYPENTQYVA